MTHGGTALDLPGQAERVVRGHTGPSAAPPSAPVHYQEPSTVVDWGAGQGLWPCTPLPAPYSCTAVPPSPHSPGHPAPTARMRPRPQDLSSSLIPRRVVGLHDLDHVLSSLHASGRGCSLPGDPIAACAEPHGGFPHEHGLSWEQPGPNSCVHLRSPVFTCCLPVFSLWMTSDFFFFFTHFQC